MTNVVKSPMLAAALTAVGSVAPAQDLAPLNSDEAPDRMDWSEFDAKFGPLSGPPEGTSIGGVSRMPTNEYWRSLGDGYQNDANKYGVQFACWAAPNEGDQLDQLSTAEKMILQGF